MAFKRLDPEDFVVSSNSVTSTVWSNNTPSLNTYFTSSTQKEGTSGPYYLNVYQTASDSDSAAVQFQIAYGNKNGGGGVNFDSAVPNVSATTTIYGQYRTLVLEDENANFIWGTTQTGSANGDNDFYVISPERARYKQTLFPGSLNLSIKSANGVATNTFIELTDNSNMVALPTYYGTQRAYQIISGSDGVSYDGSLGYDTLVGSYGLFLPDISTILLSAYALDQNSATMGINLATVQTADTFGDNPTLLYDAISSSIAPNLPTSGNVFELNSQETLTSDFVFIRARNSEYNYTENPSFISGSTGEVIFPYFINNPQTFPTTIGLYNDSNDLLAVAKLSRPIQKDFTKEALVRVKLDF
jgi:hypothetical protein|tara:strand:+ start:446 stop:1519 length:1074 start_codon:yes stop_codon:yes gene_type:complete